MKKYLVMLQGQGDTQIFLIDKVNWDWIHNQDHVVPDSIIQGRMKSREFEKPIKTAAEAKEDIVRNIHPSSWYNDRAFCLDYDSNTKMFYNNLKKYTEYVIKHSIEIIEEWEGYIY